MTREPKIIKKYLLVWKEGRQLNRTRQIGCESPYEARTNIESLIRTNRPYKLYQLIESNWY